MADSTYAFVSYAHQDFVIPNEIRDQLRKLAQYGMGGNRLTCFLDTENIEPGRKIEPIIKAALTDTDWLIVVFTGDQSVYCGFEIGLYITSAIPPSHRRSDPLSASTTSTGPSFQPSWPATPPRRSVLSRPICPTMRPPQRPAFNSGGAVRSASF